MAISTDIGLDTSVVLRLLTGEPEDLKIVAFETISNARKSGYRIMVSDLVVTEAYFALQASYKIPKKEAIKALDMMFQSGDVIPEPGGCAPDVLRQCRRASSKPGFADRLIHAQYQKSNASMLTFEKAANKLAHTEVITP